MGISTEDTLQYANAAQKRLGVDKDAIAIAQADYSDYLNCNGKGVPSVKPEVLDTENYDEARKKGLVSVS